MNFRTHIESKLTAADIKALPQKIKMVAASRGADCNPTPYRVTRIINAPFLADTNEVLTFAALLDLTPRQLLTQFKLGANIPVSEFLKMEQQ